MRTAPFCRRFETLTETDLWAEAPERFTLSSAYHDVARLIGWDRAIEFGMAVWREKRPPSTAPSDPIHGGGRGMIYIPSKLYGTFGRELIRLAGLESAGRISRAFPGCYLVFSSIVCTTTSRRNRIISEQVANGARIAAVACCFDVTERQVRRIFARSGLKIRTLGEVKHVVDRTNPGKYHEAESRHGE